VAREDSSRGRRAPQGARGGGGRGRDQRPAGRSSRDRKPQDAARNRDEQHRDQQRYDGPELPDEITGRELDRRVRQQLRSLPDRLALRVARHLVAAGQLLDSDPETAYQHTLAARSRASRLAVIREACGEAAYLAGRYAEALTELRAARRMNGNTDYLPLMADCERALGRPERALALAKEDAVSEISHETRVEMRIVASGARLDLGQPEIAAAILEGKDLRKNEIAPWSARLRYAYAVALLAADRVTEATEWFHRAAAVDATSVTDAAERVLELEGLAVMDAEESSEDEETGAGPREGHARDDS
jgi:tetratricopeptide (TPR) repeat protein